MFFLSENSSELYQSENIETIEPSPQLSQIEGFLNLLVELELLEPTKEQPSEETELTPSGEIGTWEDRKTLAPDSPHPPIPPSPPPSIPPSEENTQLERLRDLLFPPELVDTHLTTNFTRKLTKLEQQINQPTELIHLLLPLIAELLSLKITESRAEIVCALAPIIDEMMLNKTQQDKEAMILALAPVLPGAIAQQVSNSLGEIASAIAPAMAVALKEQIHQERDAMVDALYPVIGSMTSKYMGEAIRSINEKIENTFSPEGVSRKIRAKLQGVSEAELIFKEAMPFTVRAIFLIHKGSGLVISEVQPSGDQSLEAEMVAGMLTAIRSFVNDCITQSGNVSEIDAIDYGNSKIILEVAGYCYLAAVIDGEPPQWFIRKLRQTLIPIVQSYGKPIEFFEGDPATIPRQVNSILEELLEIPSKPQKTGLPALLSASLVVLSLIFLPWGFYQYCNALDRRLEAETASALASAPELSVYRLNVNADQGKLQLSGRVPNLYLRQRAEQIAKSFAGVNLNNKILAVNVPPDPVLAASEVKRVTIVLNQTAGISVSAHYAAGSVTVTGTVNQSVDAKKVTQAFQQIPGVQSVTNTLQLQPPAIAIRVYFELASADLRAADLPKIVQIKALLNQYPEEHLRIIGRSDASGNPDKNRQLALQRAKTVRDALVLQGINEERLQAVEVMLTQVDSTRPASLSRCVEFEFVTRN